MIFGMDSPVKGTQHGTLPHLTSSGANITAGITPKWVAEHGAAIGVDGRRIAFVNSVGSDMAVR